MQNYPIENRIQASITDYCKHLANEQKLIGNPIEFSFKIASLVAIGLLTSQQRKIYDCLTNVPKDEKTISQETKISKKQVINQLRNINKMTQLVSFRIEDGNKLWSKT